jgi:hypothetical protein
MYLHLYITTSEALLNTKQVTAGLISRMCFGDTSLHPKYTWPSGQMCLTFKIDSAYVLAPRVSYQGESPQKGYRSSAKGRKP